jgi:protein glucosyltransferase
MIRFIYIILFVANIAYGKELSMITAEEFLAKNNSIERQNIVSFLKNQFKDKSINQEKLDNFWKKNKHALNLSRFQIINQKLYADGNNISHKYFIALFHYLQNYLKHYKVNDIDFILLNRDEIPEDSLIEPNTPIFAMSKNTKSSDKYPLLLMPDAFMISPKPEYSWIKLINRIRDAIPSHPWEKKTEQVFWRGATTGSESKYLYNVTNFDKLNRIKLVMLDKLYPDLINAEFTRFSEFSEDLDGQNLKKILTLLFGEKTTKAEEEDHLKYKYLIAIDGNTCPWQRVPWIMLSNSVLVKQETKNIEWFYPALKPYIHYVPVNEKMTNIFSQIDWMKNHDKELQEISTNAQNFINNELMPEHIDAHMSIIFNEYAKIQQNKKIVPTLTPAEDVFSTLKLLKILSLNLLSRIKSWF